MPLPDVRGKDIKDAITDWISVIAITEDGNFVLERQYRHGLGKTCYEIPAGVIEEGETPLEAAKRELMEETGYGDGDWRELMTLTGNAPTTNNLSHCFVATNVKKLLYLYQRPGSWTRLLIRTPSANKA